MAKSLAGCWTVAAYAAGRVGRWTPQRWHSSGGGRVLVVAPHPDDEIGCGGALLLHRQMGDDVHIVHVTDGRGSRAGGLEPETMAARRREEAVAAGAALGVAGSHWLGFREWEWEEAALVPVLGDLLRVTAPDVLYAPSRVDFHPEHVRVARCLAQAMEERLSAEPVIRVYQIQVPLTPLLVNLVAPIQSVAQELRNVMRCYRTQLPSIERCQRMKRYAAAFYGYPAEIEEFWELDPAGYKRLQADGYDDGFRGIRRWPFSDPLAYLQGLGGRWRAGRAVRHAAGSVGPRPVRPEIGA